MAGTPSHARERMVAGDPIRALAALAVFAFHVNVYVGRVQPGANESFGIPIAKLLNGLNIGVWLFFVLSGYLLGQPFVNALRIDGPLPRTTAFLRNRLRRLVPPMLVIVLVTLAVEGLHGEPAWRVLQAVAFGQVYDPSPFSEQFSQLWTLDAEAVYYVLLPLLAGALLLVGDRARARTGLLLVVVLSVLSIVLRAMSDGTPSQAQLPPLVLFGFAPGLLLAAARPVLTAWPAKRLRRLSITGIALGFSALAGGAFLPQDPFVLRSLAAVAGAGLLVGSALTWQWCGRPTTRLLDNPVFQWLGDRSYSFYVFHLLIVHEVALRLDAHLSGRGLLVATGVLSLILALIVAEAAYRCLERPFLRRRETWRV